MASKGEDSNKSKLPIWLSQWLKGTVSGGITGGIEVCITFPTEFVKTVQQLDTTTGKKRQFHNGFDVVKHTFKTAGPFGFYRGLSVLLAGSIPKTGVRFGTFESLKSKMADENGVLSPGRRLLCGMGAGTAEAIIAVTPMETVKVKFIHDRLSPNPKYRGFFHGVGTIVRQQGLKGTYQGLLPTILKQGSNQMIRFTVVESLKERYKERHGGKAAPAIYSGLFGGIAGGCSVLGNTPIDVIKTRMQGLDAQKYNSTWDCVVKLLRNEGILAFYKGMGPRMTRVVLDVGITFFLYDLIRKQLDRFWPS